MGDAIASTNWNSNYDRGFFRGGRGWSGYSVKSDALRVRAMADILDGTSNTIAISEATTGISEGRMIRGMGRFGWSDSGFGSSSSTPSLCATEIEPTDSRLYKTTTTTLFVRGSCYARGWGSCTGFQTILPPNSPSCCTIGTGYRGYFSATSNHSGGVNAVFADGAVRFISETINCGDQSFAVSPASSKSNGTDPTGSSPFGVWGALGTIAGGETVTF